MLRKMDCKFEVSLGNIVTISPQNEILKGIGMSTYLAGEITGWFSQGEASPLHSACTGPCDIPQCEKLDCIMSLTNKLSSNLYRCATHTHTPYHPHIHTCTYTTPPHTCTHTTHTIIHTPYITQMPQHTRTPYAHTHAHIY